MPFRTTLQMPYSARSEILFKTKTIASEYTTMYGSARKAGSHSRIFIFRENGLLFIAPYTYQSLFKYVAKARAKSGSEAIASGISMGSYGSCDWSATIMRREHALNSEKTKFDSKSKQSICFTNKISFFQQYYVGVKNEEFFTAFIITRNLFSALCPRYKSVQSLHYLGVHCKARS